MPIPVCAGGNQDPQEAIFGPMVVAVHRLSGGDAKYTADCFPPTGPGGKSSLVLYHRHGSGLAEDGYQHPDSSLFFSSAQAMTLSHLFSFCETSSRLRLYLVIPPFCFQIHRLRLEKRRFCALMINQLMRRSGKWLMHVQARLRRHGVAQKSHRQGPRSFGGLPPTGCVKCPAWCQPDRLSEVSRPGLVTPRGHRADIRHARGD
ncbi:hypothetical protein B0T11DRAFT_279846 [Plectosphaerella cucumerina]|uniref:Uncharacterized protein n=1 Tax=Plectosphaerella cucumerina TaxID=40658 RepID=A0A8K0TG95_9PEZI|nr:hypothetical protein B0T11DRAFT_279846 [Plectosphaerella cucumerina]